MPIGDLDKRISIQAETRVGDGMGGFTSSWATVASSIAAAIWPVSASETVKANALTMVTTHRVRIRYRSVMRPSWRVSWAGRYFAIVSIIDPNEDHKMLDLMCKESV